MSGSAALEPVAGSDGYTKEDDGCKADEEQHDARCVCSDSFKLDHLLHRNGFFYPVRALDPFVCMPLDAVGLYSRVMLVTRIFPWSATSPISIYL